MTSDKQIAANRLNALKSTGPITPEGKLASSCNSFRHGMLSKSVLLHGESEERFRALVAELYETFKPNNPAETGFVESLAIASWRRMRYFTMEAAVCNNELLKFSHDVEFTQLRAPTRCGLAILSLADRSRFLDTMLRFQQSAERQYNRALAGLAPPRKRPRPGRPAKGSLDAVAPPGMVPLPEIYGD